MMEASLVGSSGLKRSLALATRNEVKLVNPEDPSDSVNLPLPERAVVFRVEFFPSGRYVVVTGRVEGWTPGWVWVFDVIKMEIVASYSDNLMSNSALVVNSLTVSSNNEYIAVVSRDTGTLIRTYSWVFYFSGSELSIIYKAEVGVSSNGYGFAAFSPDSTYAFVSPPGESRKIKKIELRGPDKPLDVKVFTPPKNYDICALAVHPGTGDVWAVTLGAMYSNSYLWVFDKDLNSTLLDYTIDDGQATVTINELNFAGGDANSPEVAVINPSRGGVMLYNPFTYRRITTSGQSAAARPYLYLPNFTSIQSSAQGDFVIFNLGRGSGVLIKKDYPVYKSNLNLPYAKAEEMETNLDFAHASFAKGV
ncbi:hypothetical protein [Vreelandella sp. EE22]